MKIINLMISFFIAIVMSACSQAEINIDNSGNNVYEGVIPEIVSAFDIQEVGVGKNGYVSLTNFTSEPSSLEGLFLCQAEACFELPEVVVQPGESVRIAPGSAAGVSDVIIRDATFGELRPSDGEIALTTSANPDRPEQVLIYLEWGSTPHTFTDLAIEAGIWLEDGYAPTSANATRLFRVPETGLWLFDQPQP